VARLHRVPIPNCPSPSFPFQLHVSIRKFNEVFFLHRLPLACLERCAWLLFVPGIRLSRVWVLGEVSCSSPAAQDGLFYVNLCPSFMSDWTDQALRVIKASYRLIVFSAESPHVATLAEVLRAGRVEILAYPGSKGLVEWSVHRRVAVSVIPSSGISFRRCHYGLAGDFPVLLRSFSLFCVKHWVGD